MGIVPKQVPGRQHTAREHRPQARAIEHRLRRLRRATNIEQRGRDVERSDRHGGRRARLHDPRPPHDQRHTDAPLVEKTLAGAERQVRGGRALGGGEAAVVAGEHDERVVGLPGCFDGGEHGGHRLVHLANHGGIDGMILHRPRRAIPLGDLAGSGRRRQRGRTLLFLDQEFRPGLQRHVHRVHRHVAEEGLVAVGRDECRRLGRDRPRMMGVVRRTAAGADVRRAIRIEAVRRDVFGWPQMPLAEDAGGIAGVLQELRHGHLPDRQGVEIVRRQQRTAPAAANKVRDLHAGRMPASHERRAGGRADRGGRVAPREEHPGGGQPVDRRRAIKRATGAAQVVGTEIVG